MKHGKRRTDRPTKVANFFSYSCFFQGCSEKVEAFFTKYFYVFVGVAFGIAAIMVRVYYCHYI